MTTAAAETVGLVKHYRTPGSTVEALRGVDLSIAPGAFVAIMGASGSGKSTLLHLLAGLDQPDAGSVRIAGQDIGSLNDQACTIFRRRHLGIVFQAFNLMPMLTAAENVALPLILDGQPRAPALDRASAALVEVGLGERATHLSDQLSGGEQQRVAFARALVGDPHLILADEPTGNLDSVAAEHIATLLRALHARGRTVVMVTHEAKLASIAQQIVVMADGGIRGHILPGQVGDAAQVAASYLEMVGAQA